MTSACLPREGAVAVAVVAVVAVVVVVVVDTARASIAPRFRKAPIDATRTAHDQARGGAPVGRARFDDRGRDCARRGVRLSRAHGALRPAARGRAGGVAARGG